MSEETTRRDAPLLVTGLPRSGTSWVGKMLEASGEVVYVNEPLNPRHPPGHSPGVLNARVAHRYQYICADNEQPWVRAFGDTVRLKYHFGAELRQNRGPYDLARMAKYGWAFANGRLRRRRALLDDPFAVLSAAWLAERVGCQAVVLVRDPVSFVGSWRKLGWTAHLHELLEQPLLLRDLLGPHVEEMRALSGSEDWLAKNALLWRLTYDVVDRWRRTVPGLAVWRYEDLARDPEQRFGELYGTLGLTWGGAARERVAEATRSGRADGRAHSWNLRGGPSRTAFHAMDSRAGLATYRERLTAEEIARVRELTEDVAARYYEEIQPG